MRCNVIRKDKCESIGRKMAGTITAPIVDGQVQTNTTPDYTSSNKGTDSLGKDAFMQMLVTQMQYQDPLEPQDNSQFLSQLAQFSSLEEMQNMTSQLNNNQALSLVGKNVIMEVGKSTGASTTTTVAGYVQYVQMVDGKAKLSINDKLYSIDDLDTVIDDKYLDSILGGSDSTTGGSDSDKEDSDSTKTE